MNLPDILRERGEDAAQRERVWLRFEERTFTFAEALREARRYANLFLDHRPAGRPFHVGLLLENRPELVFAELGAGLAGGVVVGLNPTRRGPHLARDIGFSDCAFVVTEAKYEPLLADALAAPCENPPALERIWTTEAEAGALERLPVPVGALPEALASASDVDPGTDVRDEDLCLILFTSGTTQAPKGVLRSHGPLAMMGVGAGINWVQATADDIVYTAMPLFHANAQILGLALTLGTGCGWALARAFHKTRFLDDVRRHGATLFHYVGSPLAYVMDTPERPDDADNPLRLAFGNEAPRQFLTAFARRFGCRVSDSYGASEVGVAFTRQDGDPPASLGRPMPGVEILDGNGVVCPPGRFDAKGRLVNPDEAIGEIVNTAGRGLFEGYYKNREATEERTRGGRYYTGDLGYRDGAGFVYFAGRSAEWLRVQGENFLARPVEEILARHPDVFLVAVYGVPDPDAGDRLMAAIVPRDGADLDPGSLARFLDDQPDLSPKWRPSFVRITRELRRTETNKVLKRELVREGFLLERVTDPIWWIERGERRYKRFTPEDQERLLAQFRRAGTEARLGL